MQWVPERVAMIVLLCVNACEQQADRRADRPVAGNSRTQSLDSASRARAERKDSAITEALTCSPRTIGRGDTLTVRMLTPHADYLGVDHPDGTLFFIVYPTYGDSTRKYSLIPSESFKTVATFQIPADIKAHPRVYGRDSVEPLFTRSGNYTIMLGRLETDHGPPVVRCTVRFQDPTP